MNVLSLALIILAFLALGNGKSRAEFKPNLKRPESGTIAPRPDLCDQIQCAGDEVLVDKPRHYWQRTISCSASFYAFTRPVPTKVSEIPCYGVGGNFDDYNVNRTIYFYASNPRQSLMPLFAAKVPRNGGQVMGGVVFQPGTQNERTVDLTNGQCKLSLGGPYGVVECLISYSGKNGDAGFVLSTARLSHPVHPKIRESLLR
jgi:hypothetical protein